LAGQQAELEEEALLRAQQPHLHGAPGELTNEERLEFFRRQLRLPIRDFIKQNVPPHYNQEQQRLWFENEARRRARIPKLYGMEGLPVHERENQHRLQFGLLPKPQPQPFGPDALRLDLPENHVQPGLGLRRPLGLGLGLHGRRGPAHLGRVLAAHAPAPVAPAPAPVAPAPAPVAPAPAPVAAAPPQAPRRGVAPAQRQTTANFERRQAELRNNVEKKRGEARQVQQAFINTASTMLRAERLYRSLGRLYQQMKTMESLVSGGLPIEKTSSSEEATRLSKDMSQRIANTKINPSEEKWVSILADLERIQTLHTGRLEAAKKVYVTKIVAAQREQALSLLYGITLPSEEGILAEATPIPDWIAPVAAVAEPVAAAPVAAAPVVAEPVAAVAANNFNQMLPGMGAVFRQQAPVRAPAPPENRNAARRARLARFGQGAAEPVQAAQAAAETAGTEAIAAVAARNTGHRGPINEQDLSGLVNIYESFERVGAGIHAWANSLRAASQPISSTLPQCIRPEITLVSTMYEGLFPNQPQITTGLAQLVERSATVQLQLERENAPRAQVLVDTAVRQTDENRMDTEKMVRVANACLVRWERGAAAARLAQADVEENSKSAPIPYTNNQKLKLVPILAAVISSRLEPATPTLDHFILRIRAAISGFVQIYRMNGQAIPAYPESMVNSILRNILRDMNVYTRENLEQIHRQIGPDINITENNSNFKSDLYQLMMERLNTVAKLQYTLEENTPQPTYGFIVSPNVSSIKQNRSRQSGGRRRKTRKMARRGRKTYKSRR
jgi:hypothetical protein